MRPYRAVVALACTLTALYASPAWADPTPSELTAARQLFAQAEKDEDAGQWANALDKLRRASSVKMTAGLRFHIALCEQKLGQLVAALADYTAADQAARQDNNKDVLDIVAEPLRQLRLRVPTLTLDVPDVAGAEVVLDGKTIPVGLYGIAMPVEVGSHRIEAHAHGKKPFSAEVTLKEREAQTASIRWIDLPKISEGTGGVVRPGPGPNPPPPVEPSSSGGAKVGAIVATASAAVLVGFGIGAFVAADGASSNLQAQCPLLTDCSGLRTDVRAWDAVALGSWIAAGALATVAVVLWLKPAHAPSSQAATASARLELRPLGVALTGSF